MRASDQPFVDLGQAIAEQADRDVMPFDVRVLRPGKKPDQPRSLGSSHLGQVGRGDQVLCVIEDDAETDAPGRIHLHEDALDELVEQREDHIRVARPGFGLADSIIQAREHSPQAIAIAAGRRFEPDAQIVLENDIPLPEELGRKKLGDAAIGRAPSRSTRVRSWTFPCMRKTQVVPAKN